MVHYHNKFNGTPEMFQEIKWKLINWKVVGLASGVLFAFAGGLIYAGVLGIQQNNNIATIYSFVMAAAVLLAWATTIPIKIIALVRRNDTFSEIETQFGDEVIKLLSNSEIKKQTPYKSIKSVKESKNYYLIIFENEEKLQSYLPVKKDSFLTQSDNFVNFIKQKMTNN